MKGKNLLKHNSVKFGFLVLRSLIISAILIATFSQIPIPQTKGWMDFGWTLRKPIAITNDGSELTNEDILVEVDTA